MHTIPVLSMSEARTALNVALSAAKTAGGRPVAIAIVDGHGDLLAFACMAGANPALARQNALKKAYTSACMRTDTSAFVERLRSMNRSTADFGNTQLMADAGGVVLTRSSDGAIVGGIGVSGRSSEEDEAVAVAARAALTL
jgi:uncharacterized protein GlcG (DUF336 family)